MRNDPVHAAQATGLVDTDVPIASAVADTHDHMGRRHVTTVGEAFAQDWPWIIALMLLMVFMIGALGGYWGR